MPDVEQICATRQETVNKQRFLSLAIFAVVVLVWPAELFLLERKYSIFSGGYLQSHHLAEFGERLGFILYSVWFDLLFYGFIGAAWYRLTDRFKLPPVFAAYHYFMLVATASLAFIAAKFQVLSYVSDALNFQVARELGGGKIMEAVIYVLDESLLFILLTILVISAYAIGHLFLKRRYHKNLHRTIYKTASRDNTPAWRYYVSVGFALLLVATFTHASRIENVRYQLDKKISFGVLNSAFSLLTDFDWDGYGWMGYPLDPRPFNAQIYPGALDIPNNGVDEDGLAGDFVPSARSLSWLTIPERPKNRKHLVLIVLESGRADLLDKKIEGIYVAPHIRALATAGTVIPYAYSHKGFTTSSLRILFTGKISSPHPEQSLFPILKGLGYQTAVVSGQDESFGGVAENIRMKQNTDFFFDATSAATERVYSSAAPGSIRLDEQRLMKEISRHVAETDWRQPQFLYINLQAAHFPYYHPAMPFVMSGKPIPRDKISAENKKWLETTYWNAIAYADATIGQILRQMKSKGVLERTVVVVTADHGESLFDDGYLGHGHMLNEVQTRIPLVLNTPGVHMPQPLGQKDFLALFLALITGQSIPATAVPSQGPFVFQYVGDLQRPTLIGLVQQNEQRTIFDFRKQRVFFGDMGRWLSPNELERQPELNNRFTALIHTWEQLRLETNESRQSP